MTFEDSIMIYVSVDTTAKSFVVQLRDIVLPAYFLPGTAPALTFSEISVDGLLTVDWLTFLTTGNNRVSSPNQQVKYTIGGIMSVSHGLERSFLHAI